MNGKYLIPLLFGLALTMSYGWGQDVGVDRPGSDLRPGFELATADPTLCKQACEADPNCKAYTYVRPGFQGPKARCWLKSAVPAAVQNDCCISGVLRDISTMPVLKSTTKSLSDIVEVMEFGIDRPGRDLKPGFDLSYPNPILCRQACLNDSNCKAYTYVSPGVQGPNARCWLKSEVPAVVRNDCCVSGVVGGPNALTPILLPSPAAQPVSASEMPAWNPIPMPQPKKADGSIAVNPIPMPHPASSVDFAELAGRLMAPMQRKDLIEALAGNPATRSTLEEVAGSAQMAIADLKLMPIPIVPSEASSKTPPSLLDLWKSPIHISPIAPGPWYSDGDAKHTIGMMVVPNIISWARLPCRISDMAKSGVVCLYSDDTVTDEYGNNYPKPLFMRVDVETPPGAGAYIIDIHLKGPAEGLDLAKFASLDVGDVEVWSQSVPLVSKSDGSGLIGLFTIAENAKVAKGTFNMREVSVSMKLEVEGAQFFEFGGVTITRI